MIKKMKWTDEKVEILKDGYQYMNLEKLASQIGCSVKALTRKAEKLRLFRAKNNEIKDGVKFCTFCNTYHPVSHFYKDRAEHSGKVCNGCKMWKSLNEYGRDSKGITGKRARCVNCMRKKYKKQRV